MFSNRRRHRHTNRVCVWWVQLNIEWVANKRYIRFIGSLRENNTENRTEHFNWLRLRSKMIRWFINHRTKFHNNFIFFGRSANYFARQCRPRNIFDFTPCMRLCPSDTRMSIPQSITHFMQRSSSRMLLLLLFFVETIPIEIHMYWKPLHVTWQRTLCVFNWCVAIRWPELRLADGRKWSPKKCAWDVRNPTITYLLLAVSTFFSHINNNECMYSKFAEEWGRSTIEMGETISVPN